MPNGLNKKVDMEKVVEQYLSRLDGNPDATRLLLNMLADKLTDIVTIRDYIIRHEYRVSAGHSKFNRLTTIEKLSDTYGLSKKQIVEIVGE